MFAIGDLVDRYKIEAPLGRGGMGAVFRAHDTRLRRPVALKVIDGRVTHEARALLLREARHAATLMHPNIVTVFDVGEAAGIPFLAMELVDGVTLRRHIGTSVPVTQAVRWLLDIARGLDEAHRAGLIHRDIKPGNVMITAAGAKILDFGIAKPLMESRYTAPMPAVQTAPGFSIGTPKYMAPEQLRGAPLDPKVDQFAWGLVAYELLVGKHARDDAWDPLAAWVAPPVSTTAALASIVARALDANPSQRFPTMGDVARALEPLAGSREATMEFRAITTGPTPQRAPVGTATARPAVPVAKEDEAKPELSDVEPRPTSFAEPDRAFIQPLVRAALDDIKQGTSDAFRRAVVILTVDVEGTKARFFVQYVTVDGDGQLAVPPSSVSAMIAAGNLISADARAGNGRWRQVVLRLGPSGLDPRADIEVS